MHAECVHAPDCIFGVESGTLCISFLHSLRDLLLLLVAILILFSSHTLELAQGVTNHTRVWGRNTKPSAPAYSAA